MITVYDMTSGTLQKEHEAGGKGTMQETAGTVYEPMLMPSLQMHEETIRAVAHETIPASLLIADCDRFVEGMK